MPPHAGAPEASTWSTRSAASMNDVDTDEHRHTLPGEEGPLTDPGTHPDHVHNADERQSGTDAKPAIRPERWYRSSPRSATSRAGR